MYHRKQILVAFVVLALLVGGFLAWHFRLVPQINTFFAADNGSSINLSMYPSGTIMYGSDGNVSVPLATNDGQGGPCNAADPFRSIGDYTGDGREEAYFLYCNQSGVRTMFIVDFATQSIIGQNTVSSEFAAFPVFVESVKDPQGRLHPYMANGYGDTGAWGYLCVYQPGASPNGCGAGFVRISTKPTKLPLHESNIFREVGGFAQDIDHDGWEDINLMYHFGIITVSVPAQIIINETYYDVALPDEPNSPKWFHSGRNYGLHQSFSYNNTDYNLIIGGISVGTYHSDPAMGVSDAMCNVSRFVSLLGGNSSSRSLLWSDYLGFHSNIFRSVEEGTVDRLGDFQNGCIHYFNKQIFDIGGKKLIAYNIFGEAAQIDQCIPEQKGFYEGNPTPWYTCMVKNMKSTGRWTLVVKDLLTGVDVARFPNYYVLGWSDQLIAGKNTAFAAMKLPSSSKYPFDLDLIAEKKYIAFTLSSALQMESEMDIPSGATPTLNYMSVRGPVGVGANSGVPVLVLPPGKFPLGILTPTPTPILKPADLDGDGVVGIFDYDLMVLNFGKTGASVVGDIDHNGKVDIFDYNALVLGFGK